MISKVRIRHSEGEIKDQLNKSSRIRSLKEAVEEIGKKELVRVTTENKKLSSPSPALTQLKLSGIPTTGTSQPPDTGHFSAVGRIFLLLLTST